jgi:glycosidase
MPLNDQQRPDFAKLCAALFLGLPGSYCLYQGEELGLPSAELQRADLRDPFDIALWPHDRGRDRARTPFPGIGTRVMGALPSTPVKPAICPLILTIYPCR